MEILKTGEGVGLTGDHIKLGEWIVDKSLEMKNSKRNPQKWYLKIPMCSALRIYFRFFIYYKDTRGFKRILHWEGQQHARVLEPYEKSYNRGSYKFGHAYALAVGGGVQQERGWLRKEYIVQFKFIWPQHITFTRFSHFIRKPEYILKLTAYPDGNGQSSYKTTKLKQDIEMLMMRFVNGKSKLKTLNDQQGEFYKPGDIIVFHITISDFLENLYVLGIYTRQQQFLGEAFIPSEAIRRSEGILELPILDVEEYSRVGWLTLPFLRIEAFSQAINFNMRASFHHYWPFNWPTLDIGHRGLGKSFRYHSANAVQNTIESFQKAQQVYSDMIQLEVQLTKDYVPVVWHGFGFLTTTQHNVKILHKKDLQHVYIHDFTYRELLSKRVFVFIEDTMMEMTHLNTPLVPYSKRIFPKLQHVYQKLTSTLGIVVNIKWPQLLSRGSFQAHQSLDKNRYVDEVLQTSIGFGCGRPLIMASFDADICTILRFKQHIYSVVFLHSGEYSVRESYADMRTNSFLNAIQFAQATDIMGTAVCAQEIISAPKNNNNKLLRMAFELQQLVFVWCDQLNDTSILEHFREQETAGLIYNRIDSLIGQKSKTERKRFGFFEAPELQRIFLRQCIAAGNFTISEGLPDTHTPFWPRFRNIDEL